MGCRRISLGETAPVSMEERTAIEDMCRAGLWSNMIDISKVDALSLTTLGRAYIYGIA